STLVMSLWLVVVLIGAQAFLFAQVRLRLGAHLNDSLRARAEQLAGLALVGLIPSSAMTDTSIRLSAATRRLLLRRGLRLEYATLVWNVLGSALILAAAAAARSVALAGFGLDSLIEIVASAVVVWQLKGAD